MTRQRVPSLEGKHRALSMLISMMSKDNAEGKAHCGKRLKTV